MIDTRVMAWSMIYTPNSRGLLAVSYKISFKKILFMVIANGHGVSFWGDENFLKLDCDYCCCTTL